MKSKQTRFQQTLSLASAVLTGKKPTHNDNDNSDCRYGAAHQKNPFCSSKFDLRSFCRDISFFQWGHILFWVTVPQQRCFTAPPPQDWFLWLGSNGFSMGEASFHCGTSHSHCCRSLGCATAAICLTLLQKHLLWLQELLTADWVRVQLTFSHFTRTVLKRPSKSSDFYGWAFPRSYWPDGYYEDKSNFHASTLIHSGMKYEYVAKDADVATWCICVHCTGLVVFECKCVWVTLMPSARVQF